MSATPQPAKKRRGRHHRRGGRSSGTARKPNHGTTDILCTSSSINEFLTGDEPTLEPAVVDHCHQPRPSAPKDDQPTRPAQGNASGRFLKAGSCTRGSSCSYAQTPSAAEDAQRLPARDGEALTGVVANTTDPKVAAIMRVMAQVEALRREAAERKTAAMARGKAKEDAEALAREEAAKTEREAAALARVTAQVEALKRAAAERKAAAMAKAKEDAEALVREEAAKTVSQVVLGSIVTFGGGLNIANLRTGFDCCVVCIRNIPANTKDDDIQAFLTQRGIKTDCFHVAQTKRVAGGKLEAKIIAAAESGRTLAAELDGFLFKDEVLQAEMFANGTLNGMSACKGRDTNVLTISWRSTYTRYTAEYVDIPAARAKVSVLNNRMLNGRRVRVAMNTQPPGRKIPAFQFNAVVINNVSPETTDAEVMVFTDALAVKRLRTNAQPLSVGQVAGMVRALARDSSLETVDEGSLIPDIHGTLCIRAHFTSHDAAAAIRERLQGMNYGKQQGMLLRLPDPMNFTIVISAQQYVAQEAQWNDLMDSIKDKKACALQIQKQENIVRVRLVGSAKDALGALKVRVENLARGERVEGWHRSMGRSEGFFQKVHTETGVFMRAEWKKQTLKVYGSAAGVERARAMVNEELARLSSLDCDITIPPRSVGFFIRYGLAQLKETFGEDNVGFVASSRKVTITGGEEARHAVNRLVEASQKEQQESLDERVCPVCFDKVSAPFQLGCGHVYCVACLRHYLVSTADSDQFPIGCLGEEAGCRVPVAIPTIQRFIAPAGFNRLLEAAFESYLSKNGQEYKFCKTPDCTQIYQTTRGSGVAKALQCPSCFSEVCSLCDEEAHEGLTCEEYRRHKPEEQERLNDAWIEAQGGRVRKCPQCSVPIEKVDGCNHMSCRCGAHICWRCMAMFPEDTIYAHMGVAHGNYLDDEPMLEEINYVEQRELFLQLQREEEREREAAQRRQEAERARQRAEEQRYEQMRQEWQEQLRQQQLRQEQLRQEQLRQEQLRQEQLRQEQLRQEQEWVRQRAEEQRREQIQQRQEQFRQEQLRWQQLRMEQFTQERLREEQLERLRREQQQERENTGWNCTIM